MMFSRRAVTVVATAFALVISAAACLHVETLTSPLDLSTLEMEPAKFLQIAFRDDVAVTVGAIGVAAGGPPNTRWLTLEYVEHENQKGFVPTGDVEFTNLYLVSRVEGLGEGRETLKERYLVINLWHYYPARGVKTCHVWTIWDGALNPARSRASFRLLVEDFNNTFLGERQAALDDPTIDRLTEFYDRARAFLSKGVQTLPLANSTRGGCGPRQAMLEDEAEGVIAVEIALAHEQAP
jgi:hypothetical protein